MQIISAPLVGRFGSASECLYSSPAQATDFNDPDPLIPPAMLCNVLSRSANRAVRDFLKDLYLLQGQRVNGAD